jgi:hypothetical protein
MTSSGKLRSLKRSLDVPEHTDDLFLFVLCSPRGHHYGASDCFRFWG